MPVIVNDTNGTRVSKIDSIFTINCWRRKKMRANWSATFIRAGVGAAAAATDKCGNIGYKRPFHSFSLGGLPPGRRGRRSVYKYAWSVGIPMDTPLLKQASSMVIRSRSTEETSFLSPPESTNRDSATAVPEARLKGSAMRNGASAVMPGKFHEKSRGAVAPIRNFLPGVLPCKHK